MDLNGFIEHLIVSAQDIRIRIKQSVRAYGLPGTRQPANHAAAKAGGQQLAGHALGKALWQDLPHTEGQVLFFDLTVVCSIQIEDVAISSGRIDGVFVAMQIEVAKLIDNVIIEHEDAAGIAPSPKGMTTLQQIRFRNDLRKNIGAERFRVISPFFTRGRVMYSRG